MIGDLEVTVQWLATHHAGCRIIDVREPHELDSPVGKLPGVENIPLRTLTSDPRGFEESPTVVIICHSGRRSLRAAQVLRRAGVGSAVSVKGGMLAWNAEVLGDQ